MNPPHPILSFFVTFPHLLHGMIFDDFIIFRWFFLSNDKSESSEKLFCTLLITQIPEDDYTDFLELSMNYVPV